MTNTVIIHHSADYDGIFCREIAEKYCKRNGDDYVTAGWDYGQPVPVIPDGCEVVYMLDVSIDELMDDPRLVWIDHHKSAMDKHSNDKPPGIQIDGVAACRLAWHWFFGKNDTEHGWVKADYVDRLVKEPLAVRLAGEYDVWDKRDPVTELFQFGLKSQPDLDWRTLLYTSIAELTPHIMYVKRIVSDGETVKTYADNLNAEIVGAYGFDLEFEGLTFLALNTARCNSLTFQSAIRSDHDALMGFRYDGKQWTVSLYGVPNKPDIDLSQIAVKYGGGGHKQACGFRVKTLPFLPGADLAESIEAGDNSL